MSGFCPPPLPPWVFKSMGLLLHYPDLGVSAPAASARLLPVCYLVSPMSFKDMMPRRNISSPLCHPQANMEIFLERMSADRPWLTCRGCGSVQRDEDMDPVNLGDLGRFRCSEKFVTFYTSLTLRGQSVHNVTAYQGNGCILHYHFQPTHTGETYVVENTTDGTPTVVLCPQCREDNTEKIKRMRHCRYIDHDIGIPHHMNPFFLCNPALKIGKLSALNELALARVLTCVTVVKLYTAGATPQQAGYNIRNHVFCVRSDGPEVFAAHLASDDWCPELNSDDSNDVATENHLVNPNCLETLVVYFFGDGAAYRAIKSANLIAAVTIDVDASARHLKYIVEAGTNPAYLALLGKLPSTHESLAAMLERPLQMLQERATAAVIVCNSDVTNVIERTLPSKGDGFSALAREPDSRGSEQLLEAVHKLTAEVHEDKEAEGLHASVSNELVQDMNETFFLYSGAFFLHFPLGVPSTQKRPFPQWRIAQFLQCNNAELEADPRFVGYVTGVQRRRQVNQISKVEIRPDKDGVAKFVSLTSSKTFLPSLQRHMANPETKEATAFLDTLRPLLQKTQPKLDWSPGQKQNFMPKLFGMVRR